MHFSHDGDLKQREKGMGSGRLSVHVGRSDATISPSFRQNFVSLLGASRKSARIFVLNKSETYNVLIILQDILKSISTCRTYSLILLP